MDRNNDKGKSQEKQEVAKAIRTQKRQLIRALEKRCVFKRKRVLKDVGVLVMACYHYIVEGWSFRTLSRHMAEAYHVSMSDVAWRKQFLKISDAFLDAVLEITAGPSEAKTPTLYALDATDLAMEGGKGTAVRVHTCYPLSGPCGIFCKVTDEHTAETVAHFPIQAGSVYLADRGYGRSRQLAHLLEKQADFLFRFSPRQIRLYDDETCTQRLNIDSLLEEESIDQPCWIRYRKKAYPVRLIGQRLPREQIERAEKKCAVPRIGSATSFSPVPSLTPSGFSC